MSQPRTSLRPNGQRVTITTLMGPEPGAITGHTNEVVPGEGFTYTVAFDDGTTLGGIRPEQVADEELTAQQIIDALTAAEIPNVHVAQTGGGVATIFGGAEQEDGSFVIAIGPGSYDWGTPALSSFSWEDLSVGPDDNDGHGGYAENMEGLVAGARYWYLERR